MKNKLIILGATGFIGRNLIDYLLDLHINFDIVSRDNEFKINSEFINIIYGDISDPCFVNDLFEHNKYTQCIDLAWFCGKDYKFSLINTDLVAITIGIAHQFQKNGGKQFIFAGSMFQYDSTEHEYIEDQTKLEYNMPYGYAKNIVSNYLTHFFKYTNIIYAEPRIFNIFGPYEKTNRLIPYIINSIKSNTDINLNYNNIQDYIYVKDAVAIIYEILKQNQAGIFNICSGKSFSLKDITFILCRSTGFNTDKINIINKEQNIIYGNNDKIKNILNYTYKYTLDQALLETIKNYENN